MWGKNPLLLGEKLEFTGSLPTVGCVRGGDMVRSCLGPIHKSCSASLVFFFPPEEIVSYVAVDSVSVG